MSTDLSDRIETVLQRLETEAADVQAIRDRLEALELAVVTRAIMVTDDQGNPRVTIGANDRGGIISVCGANGMEVPPVMVLHVSDEGRLDIVARDGSLHTFAPMPDPDQPHE